MLWLRWDSLPLDGRGWFAGDVEANAVNAFDLVNNACGNPFQEFVRQLCPVRGHAVLGIHHSECDGIGVSALVAHDADASDRKQHGEALPDLIVPIAGL